ncbi:hypothetical protein Slin15195_G044640 [Septoria linicola]|uniref:Uncharacterized protein n=1 Tax=Septoria linicola TaxID=215465 RepID=A0A9Q9ARD5_9PEZI|nr:hypothetical protein Slin14017_G048160 [Septoria linicola]USW51145.1 hypothetical protein Slin15195_G044640 [Septoria linicola]
MSRESPTGPPPRKRAYTPDSAYVSLEPSAGKRRKIMPKNSTISFPNHQAYDEQVVALQIELQALMLELSKTLRQCRNTSREFDHAYQLVVEAAQDSAFTKPTIGLYGRSGEGKSEMANALTGLPDGVKAVCAGKAVTSVAMLLVSSLPDQACRHAAEVRMLSHVEVETTLKSYVKAYTRYFFENTPDIDITDEEHSELEAAASLSIQRLRTLFSKFIRTYCGNDSQLVKQLMSLYEELCDVFTLRDGPSVRRLEFDTLGALNAALGPYIYDRGALKQPLLWPLVDIALKVCPDSEHLRYFNLLDLPGLAETDTGRGNIAHRQFLRCQALWAVGNICRASTDEALDNILATYGPRFGSNIAIIVTSSDLNVGSSTAHALEDEGADMRPYFDRSQHLADLQE